MHANKCNRLRQKTKDKTTSNTEDAGLKPELKTLYQRQEARLEEAKVKPGTWSVARSTKLSGKDAFSSLQDVLGTGAASALIGYASASLSSKDGSDVNAHIAQADLAQTWWTRP